MARGHSCPWGIYEMYKLSRSIMLLAAAAAVNVSAVADAAVTGAGSSFVYPVLSRWAADFKKAGGEEINYQSVGSGAGIVPVGSLDGR